MFVADFGKGAKPSLLDRRRRNFFSGESQTPVLYKNAKQRSVAQPTSFAGLLQRDWVIGGGLFIRRTH
jgi:hypothetical protein